MADAEPTPSDYHDALEAAIKKHHPDVEGVAFDEDGQHVYLAIGDETRRYRYELQVTLEAPDAERLDDDA
jgi:lipopolysaccharide export system protein LptC